MPSLSQLYRPRRFSDVTGQEHITSTLRAELATGSLGHAFLFSGPRGIGKTTCARILAKALGCDALQAGEPCGDCSPCVSFQNGKMLDVIEIDAATHTGVDMIREAIIEHVRFAPIGKRKVYILDEAHMLSTAAWNALLKTLEEPPSYAFFVFATTEWHKVPPTIVSRCQRFEFRRIQDRAMQERLETICEGQQWKIDPEATKLIVSRSEGCIRDAETLLGQVGSLAEEGVITLATAGLVIPFSSSTHAVSWLELVRDRRFTDAPGLFLSWQDEGISFVTLFDDLLLLLKRLLMASVDSTSVERWNNGPEEDRRLAHLASVWSREQIHDMALMLMERRRDIKLGMDPVFITLLAFTAALPREPAQTISSIETNRAFPPTKPIAETVLSPTGFPSTKTSTVSVVPPAVSLASIVPDVVPETPKTSIAESAPAIGAEPAITTTTTAVDMATIRRSWSAFIHAVEAKNHSLPVILKISKPERLEESTLVIRFPYAFHRDKVLNEPKNRILAIECAREAFGIPNLTLDGIVAADEPSTGTGSQDVVGSIIQAFGGSVIESV